MANEDMEDDEPRDGDEAEGEESGEEGSSKKKLILMIVAAILILLIGGGAGLYFTGMLDGVLGKKEVVEEGHEGEDTAHGEEDSHGGGDEHGDEKADHGGGDDHGGGHGPSAFVPVPKMIVNLNTDDGVPRYLRLTVQLELKDAKDSGAVEAVLPRVIDQFQTYLRELRVKDLKGSGGMYRLQMELLWRVNQAAAPIEVRDVLFQEMLIQ